MSILIAIVALIAIIAAAAQGKGYRGLYFGLAIGALILGMLFVGLTSSPRELAAMDDHARRGAEIFNTAGPPLAIVLFASAVGCLIGGCVYRARS